MNYQMNGMLNKSKKTARFALVYAIAIAISFLSPVAFGQVQNQASESQIPTEKMIMKITVVSGLLGATGLLNYQRRASLERADAREVQERRQILDPARINSSRVPDIPGIVHQVTSNASEGDVVKVSYELSHPSVSELKVVAVRIDELRQFWENEVQKLEAKLVALEKYNSEFYRIELLKRVEPGNLDRAGHRATAALAVKFENAKAEVESIKMRVEAAKSWARSVSETEHKLISILAEMNKERIRIFGQNIVVHETYPVDGTLRAKLVNLLEFRVRTHGLNGINANPKAFEPVSRAENIRIPSASHQSYALRVARGAAGGMILSLALVAYELKTSAVSDALTKTAESASRLGPVLKERLPY